MLQWPGTVVISGLQIECRDTQLCPSPTVRFGDLAAKVRLVDLERGRIVVEPPPGGGTVAVTVQLGSQSLRRIAAFHYVEVTKRPPPEFYMPVLFPVFYAGPGAFGSEWETESSLRNENDYVFYPIFDPAYELVCVVPCEPRPPGSASPRATRIVRASRNGTTLRDGALGYIIREGAAKLHFGLLVRDLSRQAEALGAEVPVVRENELHSNPFSLLNVPADDRFRTALRIYSIEKAGSVRLVIRSMNEEVPIVDAHVVLDARYFGRHPYASVVIGDLAAAYPQLRGRGPLRIEIIPESPGDLRLWGFVTVTNNETEHVTVISPQ